MAVEIRTLHRGDEEVLAKVAPQVFDNPIDAAFTKEFLADPRHHIAVAVDAGVVVGFASAVHYIHPDKPPELWINEVGLAPTHRRQGLGKALMNALFEIGRANHCKSAWVLTYRTNDAANALYSSVGGALGADDSGPADALVGYTFVLTDAP